MAFRKDWRVYQSRLLEHLDRYLGGSLSQEHNPDMEGLKTDFLLDPLRFDPRFNELVRKVNLPQQRAYPIFARETGTKTSRSILDTNRWTIARPFLSLALFVR